MLRERIYQGIIVMFLLSLSIFALKSHDNYMDLLEVNDQMNFLLDEQIESHEEDVQQWKSNYRELQKSYGELLAENEILELKQKQVELPTYNYTEAEVHLIAQCVEAEAGGYKGHESSQRYITQVILNRLHSGKFPNSVEEVIYQKNNGVPQFSVAYNGMMEEHSEVQSETLANVYKVIVHGTDLPEYILYFYDSSVRDNWVNTLNIYTTIEGTVFAYESKEEY